MNHKKRTAVLLAALMIVCTVCVTLTACNKGHSTFDPETRPFQMSISTPDGVFNPFFSTSGSDSEIISMTQIGMINTNPEGKAIVGDDEPTVVKAYTTEQGQKEMKNGKLEDITTYKFLIKNGIKWPNGTDLTIHDVLFNLYVYLDPVYTGSATIYSTDIIGLQAYRQQDPNASDTGSGSFEASFVTTANQRIDQLVQFVKSQNPNLANRPDPSEFAAEYDKYLLDVAYVAKTFYEELLSDWNAINKEDYVKWGFTEKWQIFMLNDGGNNQFLERDNPQNPGDPNSPLYKDEDGNYKLYKQYSDEFFNDNLGPYLYDLNSNYVRKDGNNYTLIEQTTEDAKTALDKAIGDYCVELVFKGKFTTNFPIELVKRPESKIAWKNDEEKNAARRAVSNINPGTDTTLGDFEIIVRYWATGSTVLDKFTAEAKTAYFKNEGKPVKTIEGITTYKVNEFNGKALGASHDVLQIEIYGVDPKAIFNFGFTVAPMYYYSTDNWNGKNYIQAAMSGEEGEFGLEFGDSDFMNEVINNPNHIGVPVGGGAYMASTSERFYNGSIVNYERNPNFYTAFGNDKSKNAKIKYVRYKVIESDQIVSALVGGDIDYGEPGAKKANQDWLKSEGITTEAITTNGYGYVGINPRFIPDVNVRRAIIKALNAASILDDYYDGGFAQRLYRPMSKAIQWLYPTVKEYDYTSGEAGVSIGKSGITYDWDRTGTEIESLLEDDYVKGNDGVYQRKNALPGFGAYKLSYKFTVAGNSNDHPAYKLFLDAAALLNKHGFDIRVVTSQTALSDLSSGKLEVWAAAWSSSVDPDMYQVYHMESQASSVKNWGYPQILGGTNSAAWGEELKVVTELSNLIDLARSIEDEESRAVYYADALDLVMELACEFPIYQRKDLFAYQSGLLDPATLPSKALLGPFNGVLSRIWEVNYYTA